jgi:regulator of protease activity HflC (stomatin/prohibitin superfamily)
MGRVIVSDWEAALLFRNGRFDRALPSGAHWFLNPFEHVEVRRLPRVSWLQERLVEALSADRFPLRVTLAAALEVVDAKTAFDADHLQRGQLALAAAVAEAAATLTLEALMTGREAFAALIETRLADAVPGCRLSQVLVTGLTLPPEVRGCSPRWSGPGWRARRPCSGRAESRPRCARWRTPRACSRAIPS